MSSPSAAPRHSKSVPCRAPPRQTGERRYRGGGGADGGVGGQAGRPVGVGDHVTSGPYDFLVHVAVPDVDSVYAFVVDRLTERREVADVQTTMLYEHVQPRCVEPTSPDRPRSARRSR
ncbi:Lrp/AsnC ligand binding domain-containing protein [Streptomyces zaehneri]|uniref:Lrp/AsnC ligand binding domain-containing protein n=1 Tax=Streptomyces zaehneri TaxID=3051180 RepID=UPI0028D58240|nr:Lrp/AsnC ligand binding domain-containing protein [Streptomyces sp. DSM 40713]